METLTRWKKFQQREGFIHVLTPSETNKLIEELLSDLYESFKWLDRLRHPQGVVLADKYKFKILDYRSVAEGKIKP